MSGSELMTLKHLKSLREANREAANSAAARDEEDDSPPVEDKNKSGKKPAQKGGKQPAQTKSRQGSAKPQQESAEKPAQVKKSAAEAPAAVKTPAAGAKAKSATRSRKPSAPEGAAAAQADTTPTGGTSPASEPAPEEMRTAEAKTPAVEPSAVKAPVEQSKTTSSRGRRKKAPTEPGTVQVEGVVQAPADDSTRRATGASGASDAVTAQVEEERRGKDSQPAGAEASQGAIAAQAEPNQPSQDDSSSRPRPASAPPTEASTARQATLPAKPAPQEKTGRRRRGGRGGQSQSSAANRQPGSPSPLEQAARAPAAIQPAAMPAPSLRPAPQRDRGGQQSQDKTISRRWYTVDLHVHTPASSDYEDPQVSYLDWLKVVAERGVEIVAITDHNTVSGIGAIRREIEWLTRLEQQNRLTETERASLAGWRDLSNKVLVLPGFEFTATFGFHILGIFPPETSVRTLEHVLLSLRIPPEKLDIGSTETGASTDVLTAYRVIREAGGLAIAAHANSTHGVAMRNFPFGGQTKIAYTQDPNLDALEVTDLDQRSHSTARFFNGSKMEYSRRMHCIQGSDSHRLNTDPRNPRRLGLGERSTEMFLDAPSFEAIANLIRSNGFDKTRPAQPKDSPFDPLTAAREEGASIVQSFHDSIARAGGHLDAVLADVCAFSNTAGGVIYIGASQQSRQVAGVSRPQQALQQILEAAAERLTPPVEVRGDIVKSGNASVLRVRVAKGEDRPYCVDEQKFYVRGEAETNLAVRDEIIAMVLEGINQTSVEIAPGAELVFTASSPEAGPSDEIGAIRVPEKKSATTGKGQSGRSKQARSARSSAEAAPVQAKATARPATAPQPQTEVGPDDAFYLPQIGVEIVESDERHGSKYHSIRDLRNGNVIRNVTRRGARDLWNYAIRRLENHEFDSKEIEWSGDRGLVHVERRAGKVRYDLALRENGGVRYFYGVTEDGMEGPWASFIQDDVD